MGTQRPGKEARLPVGRLLGDQHKRRGTGFKLPSVTGMAFRKVGTER